MAAAGFHTRKVRVEQSIGDRLKRARTRSKITVAQVEEATCIRAKFLLALESDSWDQIPSEAYGRGYLEAYARYLNLPVAELMGQYERSRATYGRHQKDVQLAPVTAPIARNSFFLTPRLLMMALLIVGGMAFVGTLAYQVSKFSVRPFLEVTPVHAQTIGDSQLEVHTDSFTISGRTAIGATVRVNGQAVIVLSDGSFTGSVPVQKGVNAVVVEATNPSGKTSRETLTVTVK